MNRLMESQDLIRECMAESLGIYMAKEPKIRDQWREETVWKVLMHLKHEIEEIERSKSADRQYHNALDACGQAAILAARIRLEG